MVISAMIILFLIGFLSDLSLQVLQNSMYIPSLFKPFWQHYGSLRAAVYAGLITLGFGGAILLVSLAVFNWLKINPYSLSFVLFATAMGYVLGIIIDVYTNRNKWLGPSFNLWYNTMSVENAAMWTGGLTFAFTLFIATIVLYWIPTAKLNPLKDSVISNSNGHP